MSQTEHPHLNSYQVHLYRSQKAKNPWATSLVSFIFLYPTTQPVQKNVASTFQIDPEFHHLYFIIFFWIIVL